MTSRDPVLDEMLAELADLPTVHRPSPFWQQLNEHHLALLEAPGIGQFKRTINVRYFSWRALGILRHQLVSVAKLWAADPHPQVLGAVFPRRSTTGPGTTSFNPLAAWLYKTYVAMYADVLDRGDSLGLLDRLNEPELGDPFIIEYRGRSLSQDLCNSIQELYTILDPALPDATDAEMMEIGAGYGRIAYVFLSAFPKIRYTIIDLPPALYLAQRYLTELFPDVPTFRFRRFESHERVRNEFEHARLRFLEPHQAELVRSQSIDQVIAISALHEMTMPQLDYYFALIDRVCRGRMYMKMWRMSRASVNRVMLSECDYPVPIGWRTIIKRRHPIQSMFFEAMYDVR